MDYFNIEFRIRPRPVDRGLVSALVEAVTDLGSIYDEEAGYWNGKVDDLVGDRPLEEAIGVVSEYEGSIWFLYNDMSYLLTIHPQTIEKSKLGYIGVWIDYVYLQHYHGEKDLEECMRHAEQLVEIAKAVWNVLEPKPIYGLGDYDIYDWLTTPTDEEILNLKVEPHIYRLNFYGPELIKKFGKRKLLSMPAYGVEELDEGCMFLGSPLPLNFGTESYKKISDHLGWKIYFVNIFNIERFKMRVKEYGICEKKFQDISALKKYLKKDIAKFRSGLKDGRVFAILETPSTKPVPHHVTEMERWLRDEMRVDARISRW
jgi:hypothetical protein